MQIFKQKQVTDEALMQRVIMGDKSAFDDLYNRYNKPVYYYIVKIISNKIIAEDILHDVFIKVIEKPEMFDGTRQFKPWIYTVAHNMSLNEIKKQKIRNNIEIEDDQFKSNEEETYSSIHSESLRAVHKHIKSLEQPNKSIMVLRYKMGMSIKEISDVVNIPEGTVKSKIHYVIKQLSTKIN